MKIPDIDKEFFSKVVKVTSTSDNDIIGRCPICGDSKKSTKKARLHLYIKPSFQAPVVHCFNCDYSSNVYNFLKTVDATIATEYLNTKKTEKIQKLKSFISPTISGGIKIEKKNSLVSFKVPYVFESVSSHEEHFNFLKKRGLEKFKNEFFVATDNVTINNTKIYCKNYLIVPFKYKDKLIGFQMRDIKNKIFKTFLPDENIGYKVWNLFNILSSTNEKIYAFEGVFDALASGFDINEVIAINGTNVSNNVELLLQKVKKKLIYVLDNQNVDITSKKKSKELLLKNKNVFVYPKHIIEKDANDLLLKKKEYLKIYINSDNIYNNSNGIVKLFLT